MTNLFFFEMGRPFGSRHSDYAEAAHASYLKRAEQVRRVVRGWGENDIRLEGAIHYLFSGEQLIAKVGPDGVAEVAPGQRELWDAALEAATFEMEI